MNDWSAILEDVQPTTQKLWLVFTGYELPPDRLEQETKTFYTRWYSREHYLARANSLLLFTFVGALFDFFKGGGLHPVTGAVLIILLLMWWHDYRIYLRVLSYARRALEQHYRSLMEQSMHPELNQGHLDLHAQVQKSLDYLLNKSVKEPAFTPEERDHVHLMFTLCIKLEYLLQEVVETSTSSYRARLKLLKSRQEQFAS